MPTDTYSANISLTVVAHDVAPIEINPAVDVGFPVSVDFTFGTGVGALGFNGLYQFDRVFSGSTDVLNLTSGLLDGHGNAIDWARVKFAMITNLSSTNNVSFGGGTNPCALTTGQTLPPGAFYCVATPEASGWAVTASTGMNLNFTGTSGQSYQVILGGANA